MKLIVAVSGGVDSVVLLDMLMTGQLLSLRSMDDDLSEVVVAHFDHGIRPDSVADARFVEALARQYGVKYIGRREELGSDASEEKARERRYGFLHEVAKTQGGVLVTAHHQDDLVETIALNVERGTRWRGLATMSDKRITRPLLKRTKSELIAYASKNRLEWVEDETNQGDQYRRNQIRRQTALLSSEGRRQLYDLRQNQARLKTGISRELEESDFPIANRYFITMIAPEVARELLYSWVVQKYQISLLGQQLSSMLYGIKLGRPGTVWQIGQGLEVTVARQTWSVQVHSKMIK